MPALPIIEDLNVLEDIPCRVFTGDVVPRVHEFTLERPEEALHTGVVPAVPSPRHAGGDAVSGEQQLVTRGGILAAAIRMVQEPSPWVPVRQRHGEGLLGQLHGQSVAPRPADHGARVEVEHHGEVEPALRGPDVGDVPGPHPVWLLNRELAREGVFCHGQPVIRLGGGSPLLHGLGPDPFDAHEPRDAVLTNPVPSLDQGVPDAGTAVGLTGLSVDHPDGREQGAVVHRPVALWSTGPGIVAGG